MAKPLRVLYPTDSVVTERARVTDDFAFATIIELRPRRKFTSALQQYRWTSMYLVTVGTVLVTLRLLPV